MRQAGVIAAAARVALAGRDRLVEDHELAQKLAGSLAERYPGSIDPETVETNMIRLDFESLEMTWEEVSRRLEAAMVKVSPPSAGSWRIVVHRDVDAVDADRLIAALS